MIRCHKCGIEKEDNHFQKYWHSTQKKHRIRKECTECFYKQRNERRRFKRLQNKELIKLSIPTDIILPHVPELEPEVLQDEKKCNTCGKIKNLQQFYKSKKCTKGRANCCIECEINKEKEERELELIENGGSLLISPKPNQYKDKYQKELVFQFLPLCGWIFNEENGIWYKPGFKDENGNFINIRKRKKILPRKKLTKEQIDNIYSLKSKGYKPKYISEALDINQMTVYNAIKRIENENNKSW